MKKILALLLVLALCFSLVAFAVSCGGPEIPEDPETPETPDPENPEEPENPEDPENPEEPEAPDNVGTWLPID